MSNANTTVTPSPVPDRGAPTRTLPRPGRLPASRDYLQLTGSSRARWAALLGSIIAIGAFNVDLYRRRFRSCRKSSPRAPYGGW